MRASTNDVGYVTRSAPIGALLSTIGTAKYCSVSLSVFECRVPLVSFPSKAALSSGRLEKFRGPGPERVGVREQRPVLADHHDATAGVR